MSMIGVGGTGTVDAVGPVSSVGRIRESLGGAVVPGTLVVGAVGRLGKAVGVAAADAALGDSVGLQAIGPIVGAAVGDDDAR